MEEYLSAVFTGLIASVVSVVSNQRGRRLKKRILLNRLTKDGWEWRSLKSLSHAIGEDEFNAKELLLEIGARASTGSKEVWTLENGG